MIKTTIYNKLHPGLKVRGLGGLSPPALSSPPQLRGKWGGRLREGITERSNW